MRWTIVVLSLLGLACLSRASTLSAPAAPVLTSWQGFWNSVHVTPAPPEDFLDGPGYAGKILNLTAGRLSDAVVKKWVLADLRRGRGDAYGGFNLRRDIVDAGVFGPPGLNGTGNFIDSERALGAVRLEHQGRNETIAAAVIYVPQEQRTVDARARYTEYVIVLVRRMSGLPYTRIHADGRREQIGQRRPAGDLAWQLDTGNYFEHPVLGALWYQQMGWACRPEETGPNGKFCGLVKP